MFATITSFISSCLLSDVRTDSLKKEKIDSSKAKEYISKNLNSIHKTNSWQEISELEFILVDEWASSFIRGLTILPENKQKLKVRLQTKSGEITIEFLDGKEKGKIFGIEKNLSYLGNKKENFPKAKIYLESLSLYLRLTFLLENFKLYGLASEEYTIENKKFTQIFATNGLENPESKFDQYLFLINSLGKIENIIFTYREVFDFYKGNLKLENYDKLKDIEYPKLITINDSPKDTNFTHRLIIEKIEWK
ncbi:MAG: hypothetical protein SFU98_23055 [Leptospiraceae bacterium]|nr:hypothetical protein [Leptospiraceae bacterium]